MSKDLKIPKIVPFHFEKCGLDLWLWGPVPVEGGLLLHHVVLQLRLERHLALALLDGGRLSQWVQVLLSGEEAVAAVAAAEAEDQVINLANMKKASQRKAKLGEWKKRRKKKRLHTFFFRFHR